MRIGKFVIDILKYNSYKSTLKRRKLYKPYGKYEEKIDIPYIDDGNYHHKFDVIYGKVPKKKCCLIDIHGGSYIFGEHIDQYAFGEFFLDKGYDFISVDYVPNDGKMSIKDLFDDLYHCFKYIFAHQKELGVEGDDFVITGDSAGGHMCLTMAQVLCDKEYAKELGYEDIGGIKPVACLPNCPVYDFVNLSKPYLTRSGMKRLFGTSYKDKATFALLSPKEHLSSLTCPTFVSTCKRDFLRDQALLLAKDMKDRDVMFEIMNLDTDDKSTGHVHNVLDPFKEYSLMVNQAMMDFIEKARNK